MHLSSAMSLSDRLLIYLRICVSEWWLLNTSWFKYSVFLSKDLSQFISYFFNGFFRSSKSSDMLLTSWSVVISSKLRPNSFSEITLRLIFLSFALRWTCSGFSSSKTSVSKKLLFLITYPFLDNSLAIFSVFSLTSLAIDFRPFGPW